MIVLSWVMELLSFITLALGSMPIEVTVEGEGGTASALQFAPLTSREQVYELALEVSGSVEFANFVVPVAWCESRYDGTQVNKQSFATGLMQIHPIHESWIEDLGYSWDEVSNNRINLIIAWHLYQLNGTTPWKACL